MTYQFEEELDRVEEEQQYKKPPYEGDDDSPSHSQASWVIALKRSGEGTLSPERGTSGCSNAAGGQASTGTRA
jgi:hypothetical protein